LIRSLAPAGLALMGSTSITLGEVVALTSPTEAPPASTVRRGVSTLESATGEEFTLLSTAPRSGVAVRASSASASPTTFGSADLVRDGEAEAPRSSCGIATGTHSNTTSKQEFNSKQKKIEPSILYLVTTRMRSLGLNRRGQIAAGILACTATAFRCASKPRRRASSDVFYTSSRYLVAAGLSDLLIG
jgi:hypothetical protein